MRIERHIFGSYKGYTTLARSAGVSVDDCRILESSAHSFGQTYDARFNKALASTPAFFTRNLCGRRRALARVLEGALDDNDRPTLRVVTVIVSQHDWDAQLCGDVQLLLEKENLWQWDGSAQLSAIEVTFRPPAHSVPRGSVPRVLALLSEIEHSHAAHRGVVVSAKEFSQQEIVCVEMLIPPSNRAGFTSAYRALSPKLPAAVNCLAAEAGSQDRVTFHFQPEHIHPSPYAQYLLESGFSSGSIPLESIMAYKRFGLPPVKDTPVSAAPITVVRRANTGPLVAVTVLAVVMSMCAFVGAQLLSREQTDDLRAGAARLGDANAKLAKELSTVRLWAHQLRDANSSQANELSTLKSSIEGIQKRIDAWDKPRAATTTPAPTSESSAGDPSKGKRIDELHNKLKEVSSDLKETMTLVNKLNTVLRDQQKAHYDQVNREMERLIKKAKDEGILRQNAKEFKQLTAEAEGLNGKLLGEREAESLEMMKAEAKGLGDIVETLERTVDWEKKMAGVKSKTKADKAFVAKEIVNEVRKANTLLEVEPEFTMIDVKDDYAKLKERVATVWHWVNKILPDSSTSTTAKSPG